MKWNGADWILTDVNVISQFCVSFHTRNFVTNRAIYKLLATNEFMIYAFIFSYSHLRKMEETNIPLRYIDIRYTMN